MWWWTDGWGFWLLVPVFMVICAVAIGRMMRSTGGMRGMGMCGFGGHGSHRDSDGAEQILDERLACGEIDVEEHRRLRDAIANTNGRGGGRVGIRAVRRETPGLSERIP